MVVMLQMAQQRLSEMQMVRRIEMADQRLTDVQMVVASGSWIDSVQLRAASKERETRRDGL